MSGDGRHKSYCRICQGFCGVEVSVDAGRVVAVRGDRDDPLSRGYACFKGLQAAEQHNGEGRLLSPLVRSANGELAPTPLEEALADAGVRLRAILDTYGPESIALFMGTQSLFNTLDPPMIEALARGIGTPRLYGTMTIDQSAKWIAEGRLGGWDGGVQQFDDSDVWMFVGANPLVSVTAGVGGGHVAFSNPVKAMKDARARGMKLIVVDPRRTETAEFADLHLPLRPGTDAELLAGMLHVILANRWHDTDFCVDHVDGVDALARAVASFDPERCAACSGVAPAQIVAAAEMFARTGARGMASSGTGPNMGRHSNLAEHLLQCINIVCGRFPRAGEMITNPGTLQPARERRAQVCGPARSWETGPRSRVHGLGTMKGQMMSATIADEIAYEGEGRIRALICVGGNPAVALPDQGKAERALSSLGLLIAIEPRMTATARLATHVFPPKLQYERPDHTGRLEHMFKLPFAHATPALVQPPADAEVVDDWYVLWSLARSLGVALHIGGAPVDMVETPATEAMLAMVANGGRVPLDIVRALPGGGLFPARQRVQPADASASRFELLAPDVAQDLAALAVTLSAPRDPGLTLIVRRHREVMNSTGADMAATRRRFATNPAYLHPETLASLGLVAGQAVRIASATGAVEAVVRPDPSLRMGVAAMSHCWSGSTDRPYEATNALVNADDDLQAINRMPVMTGVAVTITQN